MLSARRTYRTAIGNEAATIDLGGEITGIDYLIILYREKWILLGVLALCVALAYTASRVMTPKYEAVVVLVPTQEDNNVAVNPQIGNFLLGMRAEQNERRDVALAALDSRPFVEAYIADHNLLPLLFPERWDQNSQDWLPDAMRPTLENGYGRLHAAVRIEKSNTDTVVRFIVKWRNAKLAADWANGLVAKANAIMRAKAIATADNMISYLNSAWTQTTIGDVRISISNLIEQQIKQRMMAQGREDYALDVIAAAEPTAEPAGPGLLILLAGGVVLGLLLGVPAAVLRHSLAERRRYVPLTHHPAPLTGE